MRRIYKQIIIIVAVIVVIAGTILGVQWLTQKTPTCFDGIQNGEEEGADCGAVCGNNCNKRPTPNPVTLENFKVVEGGGKCDLVALVSNPNVSFGAKNIPYRISWGSFSRNSGFYIYPSEERFVAEINVPCQPNQTPQIQIDNSATEWKYLKGFSEKPNIEISDAKFAYTGGQYDFSSAEGLATNKSPFDLKEVEIFAIVKNSSGETVAINKTTINSLLVGQRREFRIFWTHPFPKGGVNSFYVTTNLFNTDNFIKLYGAESTKWNMEINTNSN